MEEDPQTHCLKVLSWRKCYNFLCEFTHDLLVTNLPSVSPSKDPTHVCIMNKTTSNLFVMEITYEYSLPLSLHI